MITPREPGDQVDVRAVVRDDELLDRIAAGAQVPDSDDPAVALLQTLVRDVDSGLDTVVEQPLPPVHADGSRWLQHRRTLRGTVAVAVVGLGLSVGGVSAAVTGNPLAAYESVVGVFDSSDELPPTAAEIAKWNKKLVAARASVRAGDGAKAQAQIEVLRTMIGDLDVSDERRAVLERKLAKLTDRLESDSTGVGSTNRSDKAKDNRPADKPAQKGERPSDKPARPDQSGDQSGDQSDRGQNERPAADPPAEAPAQEQPADEGQKGDARGGPPETASTGGPGVAGAGNADAAVDKGATPEARGNAGR